MKKRDEEILSLQSELDELTPIIEEFDELIKNAKTGEEASAIAFQIKASDLPDDVKEKNLADLRRDFLQTIAGFGITQYTPQF